MKARIPKPETEPYVRLTESQYHQLKVDITEDALRQGAVQGIAAVLLGLSRHGFGQKRLTDALNWAQEILEFPAVFDRPLTADDVLDYLDDKFNLCPEDLTFKVDPAVTNDIIVRVDERRNRK